MFSRKREETLLEYEIKRVLEELRTQGIGSQEYVKTLNALITLHEMRDRERPKPLSRDTLAVVGANILGIILIINHEYAHPIVSRAMSLLIRTR